MLLLDIEALPPVGAPIIEGLETLPKAVEGPKSTVLVVGVICVWNTKVEGKFDCQGVESNGETGVVGDKVTVTPVTIP